MMISTTRKPLVARIVKARGGAASVEFWNGSSVDLCDRCERMPMTRSMPSSGWLIAAVILIGSWSNAQAQERLLSLRDTGLLAEIPATLHSGQ